MVTELISKMHSQIIINLHVERRILFTTRYANLWTKIFQKKKKPSASEVSVSPGFSRINSAVPLIISRVVFFFIGPKEIFSQETPRTLSPDTFLRNNACLCYTSRVSIPAALRDRTTVIKSTNLPSRTNLRNLLFRTYCVFHRVILHKL